MKLLFFVLGLLWVATPATSYANYCKKVIATAHPEYPPYHWREDDKIVGASVDITRKIFAELDIEFEARYTGPWKRVLSGAQNNNFDMVLALKQTQERETFLTYTTSPILPNPFAIFVRETDNFEFKEWKDLIGKKGGKNAGDRYGDPFDSFLEDKLTIENGYTTESNVKKLLQGRIDYFIHGRYVGRAHFATLEEGYQLKALALNINEGFIHSGFTKESPCVKHLPYLSKRYKEILASGEAIDTLSQNIAKWADRQLASRHD